MEGIMKELSITLRSDIKKPLYEQIYDAIRQDILNGKIGEGEKLPSTRFQSEYLQVSRSTVELAYEQLLSEGYIYSEPYRGYYACDVQELYQLSGMERKTVAASQEKKAEQKPKKQTYRIDFSPNGIDLEQFPYAPMGKIMRNLMLDQGEQMLHSSLSFGDEKLRGAICEYLYRSRNVNCEPQQIILGAGNEYLQLLLSQILGKDRWVAMESPTYLQAYRTFCNIGYKVKEIELDESGLLIGQLRDSGADLAYVMPSHQFPLGTVMQMKRRLELLGWAAEKPERYIIEDDYDSEFRYKGKPIPALQGMDRGGNVIYLGTFSKSIAPSTRVSYMVLPEKLLETYIQKCGFYSCTVPNIMQQTIYQLMQEGVFEKNLNRMRGIYKGKHDYLLAALRQCDWAGKVMGENAGLHFLVEVNSEKHEEEILEGCKKEGVRVYGISEYFISRNPHFEKPVLLLGYGGLTEKQMREGLEIIGQIV